MYSYIIRCVEVFKKSLEIKNGQKNDLKLILRDLKPN